MSSSDGPRKSEPPAASPPPASSSPPASSASRDLADGLELMLRAARKAVRKVDPTRIEQAGRRALESLESLDAKKVGALGKKAAKNLDPRHIEEVAEDAGRELLNVVERIADRVETIVGKAMRDDEPSANTTEQPAEAVQSEPAAKGADSGDEPAPPRARIRIEDG